MVHAINITKCEKGHVLPLFFDDNKCGCHHDGMPCISLFCEHCLKEWQKDEIKGIKRPMPEKITIPLSKEGIEVIKKLIKN